MTVIADRERDIFEVFADVPDARTDLLIRVAQNRCVDEEPGKLFEAVAAGPCQHSYALDIAATPTRPACVRLWALETREPPDSVPPGEEPICWRVLTTHPLDHIEMACQVIRWHHLRWLIEELFRALKRQRLNIEASQLESGEGLRKNCLMTLAAALPILQLTLERDGAYGVSATHVFAASELLYQDQLGPTLEGPTVKPQNPFVPRTLAWSAWIIGRLGGWKGYRSQSPPGYITMKRGLERFASMFAGWQLAQNIIEKNRLGERACQEKDMYKE